MRRAIGWTLLAVAVLLLIVSARHSALTPAGSRAPRQPGAHRSLGPMHTPSQPPLPLGEARATDWPITPASAPGEVTAAHGVSENGTALVDRATADAALLTLNGLFRSSYSRAREVALAQAGPVIIAQSGKLTLLRAGERSEGTELPAIFHDLKTIAHVPLAIYVMLAPHESDELPPAVLEELDELLGQIARVRAVLDTRGLSPEQLTRQQKILDLCSDYVAGVRERGHGVPEHLQTMTARLGPLTLENIVDAAHVQIDHYHTQVAAWRSELAADEWARLRVVVIGRQMPRRDNLTTQFFARLLGEPGEGARIIYAEGLGEQPAALALLGTHLIDTAASAAFFGDGQRIHRDLLGDAAAEYLQNERFGPGER